MKWRMLMIFGLVSLIWMSVAKAESDDVLFAPTSRLISYDLLMRLKPENRALYMQELRILMMEMEALQNYRGQVDPQLYRRMNSRLDVLSTFIQDANAAGANAPMSCRPPLRLWRGTDRKYYCLDMDLARSFSSPTRRSDGSLLMRNGVNPYANMSFPPDPNRKFCSIYERYPFPLAGTAPRQPAGRSAPAPAATTVRRGGGGSEAGGGGIREERRPAPERRSVRSAPTRRGVAPQGTPTVAAASAPFNPGPVTNIPDIEAVETCSNRDAEVPARTGLKCDAPKILEARRDFRGREHRTCVYAGHMRRYRNDSAAPGQCQPITRWCINNADPEDCQVPTDPAHHFTPVFSCPANQVLCSPLLFGVRKRASARGQNRFESYCVGRSQNATEQCYNMVNSEPTGANPERVRSEGIEHIDLLNQNTAAADYLANAIDPEDRERLSTMNDQLRPMYEQLAGAITDMCINDGKERQVFCQECFYIRKRLAEMQYISSIDTTKSCMAISVGTMSTAVAASNALPAPLPVVASVLPGEARPAPMTVEDTRRGLPPPVAPGAGNR